MSNYIEKKDPIPFIAYAGAKFNKGENDVDKCLQPDLYNKNTTETPQNLIKFRHTRFQEPGVKTLHRGYYELPKDYEQLVHGVKSKQSDHVKDCIKSCDNSGINHLLNEIKEERYSSTKREPLGHSIMRNYNFPDEIKSNNFKFGKVFNSSDNVKNLIYNCTSMYDPPVEKLHRNSQFISKVGEPISRNYNWNFELKSHCFGLPQEIEKDGVKKSLNFDLNCPCLTDSNIENTSTNKSASIREKSRLNTLPNINSDFVFGRSLQKKQDSWNAAKCIYGDPKDLNSKHFEVDKDLGRNWRYKNKLSSLQPIEYDINKVFGIPSIRRDLPKKIRPSFTDGKNYGDQGDAFELLYPHPCSSRGVTDEDFDQLFSMEDIKQFLVENNQYIPENEFSKIWEISMNNYPNPDNKLSVAHFMATMRNLKREYLNCKLLQKNDI